MIQILYKQITVFNSNQAVVIEADHYKDIIGYLRDGNTSDYASELIQKGSMQLLLQERNLINAMHSSLAYIEGAFSAPFSLNMEVTSKCPLHCPQCYCDLKSGEDLPIDVALKYVQEAARMGISRINISGGETMMYPYLIPLIEECNKLGLYNAIAISGCGFTKSKLEILKNAGLNELSISLNGSTEAINQLSRDGYHYAIQALRISKESDFRNVFINWVAHNNNIHDFMNVVDIAYKYHVRGIEVLGLKPTSQGQLNTMPSKEQLLRLIEQIESIDQEKLQVTIEDCFCDYQVLKHKKHFCAAGICNFSITRNGSFAPCRHLTLEEQFNSLEEYWNNSYYLKQIRSASTKPVGPCADCPEQSHCLPCYSVVLALSHKIERSNPVCVAIIEK